MKVSTRINGRVTSVSVRDSVCALHYVVCGNEAKKVEDHVLDVCHSVMDEWEGDTAKGLSGFIVDTLLADMLDQTLDVKMYKEAMERLEHE